MGSLLLGKKVGAPAIAGDIMQTSALGGRVARSGLGVLEQRIGENVENLVGARIADQERLARGGFADEIRRAQQRSAQLGLGRTSLGIATERGARASLADRLRAIRGSRLEQISNERRQRALDAVQSGGQASRLANPLLARAALGGRRGGLLKPALALGGGFLGAKFAKPGEGAEGFKAGLGAGAGAGLLLESAF